MSHFSEVRTATNNHPLAVSYRRCLL